MALEQKLSLKLTQKLVMTPSLQQAIKLLQMTKLELESVVTQELVENPVLERLDEGEEDAEPSGVEESGDLEPSTSDEGEGAQELSSESQAADGSEDVPSESAGEGERDTSEAPQDSDSSTDDAEGAEGDEDLQSLDDIDIDAYFNDYLDGAGSTAASTFEMREAAPLENTVTAGPELSDHLLWQVQMMDLDPLQRELTETVIGNLDEDGFLHATVEEIQLLGAEDRERALYQVAKARYETYVEEQGKIDESAAEERDVAPGEPAVVRANRTASGFAVDQRAAVPASSPIPQAQRHATVPGHLECARPETAVESPSTAPELPEVPGYPRPAVEEAIERVQALDPPGVGAANLRESLLLQLRLAGEEETLAYELIESDWDRLLKRQFPAIAKDMGVPLADLEEPFERIKLLETRPGRQFGGSGTQYVEPDVEVVKVGGEYVIQINDDGMPRLRVSKAYRRMLQKMRADGREKDAQQYLREKMRSAIWLIKSLDQRQRTIYKVADSIVKQQKAFLESGLEYLRPMVLRDVAEDIGMHESTVSRVVSNKYIHTPRGLYPMKFFFHSGIDSDQGEDISSLTVKRKLKRFIEGENPKKPLSDSALMKRLNAEGIKIARRTVAKYRDELNIPSSTDRKQIF